MLEGTEQFSKPQPRHHRELPSSGERSALSGEVLMFLECKGTQEERLSTVTHHLCAFSNKKQRQPVRVGGRQHRVTCSSSPEAQVRGHCFLAKVTSRCHVSILDQTRREPVILTRTKTLKMQFP